MKKLFIALLLLFIASPSFAVVEWQKDEVAGTRSVSDIDYYVTNNNANLDKLLTNYREGVTITYNDNASIVVTAGEIVCSNAAGTVRRMRKNTASVTSTWSVGDNGLDAGTEASSTTYYVFAEADADADTFKIKISTSSTAPSGVTYYKRIGSFYNDGSSNITQIINDNAKQIKECTSKTASVSYQALSDGEVMATAECSDNQQGTIKIYSDNTSSPTILRAGGSCAICDGCAGGGGAGTRNPIGTATFSVKQGDYYKATSSTYSGSPTYTVYFCSNN